MNRRQKLEQHSCGRKTQRSTNPVTVTRHVIFAQGLSMQKCKFARHHLTTPQCPLLEKLTVSQLVNKVPTNLLWYRVLLDKLTGLQLVKKFSAFHGTRKFITALRSVRHLSLSWASPIQSIYPHPTSWRSILILSTHLRLGLPSGSFPPVSPPKPYTPPSPHPYGVHQL